MSVCYRLVCRHIEGSLSAPPRTIYQVWFGGALIRVFELRRDAIAKVNSCQVVNQTRSKGNAFFFVGRTSDRELAKILYLYLVELGEELVAKAAREDRDAQTIRFNLQNSIRDYKIPAWAQASFNRWMKDYRESWKTGFGDAISTRLQVQYDAMLAAQQSTASNAIVHINADALAVKAFLQGKVSSARTIHANGRNEGAYAKGQSTGNAVNLSPNRFGVASGRAGRLLGS